MVADSFSLPPTGAVDDGSDGLDLPGPDAVCPQAERVTATVAVTASVRRCVVMFMHGTLHEDENHFHFAGE